MMDYWVNILEKLRIGKDVALLYVLDSSGSSPGRQGFRMMISADGHMEGSIGGGIMEHKLSEYARTLLTTGHFTPFIKHQIHQSEIPKDRSGMICSGQQTIAFYCLTKVDLVSINTIVDALSANQSVAIELDQDGLSILKTTGQTIIEYHETSTTAWKYTESLGFKECIHIIGAGHVSLALSEVMNRLGFYVEVIDDRADINTFTQNHYAHKKTCIPFHQLGVYLENKEKSYVAVMTFGYRSDEECIKQLIGKKFKYLGVMGSKEKMKRMLASLRDQGLSASDINKINTPIGLSIHSKTPMEIAVSVAGEIISIKNG